MGLVMKPAERVKWFEHNLYFSLHTTDEYVWVWSEAMNYWENKNVPEGFIKAMESAKYKFENSKPLGFAIDTLISNAQKNAIESIGNK